MGLIVTKYGGTSNASAEQLRRIAQILTADPQRRVVVVSAPGKTNSADRKVTDLFIDCFDLQAAGQSVNQPWSRIAARFQQLVDDLQLDLDLQPTLAEVRQAIEAGANRDYCASRGEAIQALIVAKFLGAVHVEAAEVIFFKQSGQLDKKRTYAAIRKRCSDLAKLYVLGGFYGSARGFKLHGGIKTFSRGGSDITGAIVAAALHANVYENWTDVSGVFTTDPRVVPTARVIREITYRELRELAYTGASVLHEEAVFPVRELSIPINVRNTNEPDAPGTMIVAERNPGNEVVVGMAGKPSFVSFDVEKGMMNQSVGFGQRLLQIFARNGVAYDHTPTGIDRMSVIAAGQNVGENRYQLADQIREDLSPDSCAVTNHLALIALVGLGLRGKPGTAAKLAVILANAGIDIRYLQWADGLSLMVGVNDDDFPKAMQLIHAEFFPAA